MKAMPFQQWTITAALKALSHSPGPRRFLVADEVGLGKTIVAGEVLQKLAASRKTTFRVFYVAPGHAIAQQNLKRLRRDGDPIKTEDRLGLLQPGKRSGTELEIYAFAPETSFHTRGTGRWQERLRLQILLDTACPGHGLPSSLFRKNVAYWPTGSEAEKQFSPSRETVRCFRSNLHRELDVPSAKMIETLQKLKIRPGLIGRLRRVLAITLLESHPPDLIVLDEFQRYRDLLEDQSPELFQRMLQPFDTDRKPAVLLLSATPFKLLDEGEAGSDRGAIYDSLFRLLKFLAGDNELIMKEAQQQFSVYRKALEGSLQDDTSLVEQHLKQAMQAKRMLEASLRPLMCRTERRQFQTEEELSVEVHDAPIALSGTDLQTFRHLAEAFRVTRKKYQDSGTCCHPGDAVSFWSSIPLPAQSMGKGYQAWRESASALASPPPPVRIAPERIAPGRKLSARDYGSPKLRHLKESCTRLELSLPWCAPSLRWWVLGGAWQQLPDGAGQKMLLFSRFRATPGAIAALMSRDVKGNAQRRRSRIRGSGSAYAAFYPSPLLAGAIDPGPFTGGSFEAVRKGVEKQLMALLRNMKVRVLSRGGTKKDRLQHRPLWKLLSALEQRCVEQDGEAGRRIVEMRREWQNITSRSLPAWFSLSCISRREFQELVALSIDSPGVVVLRAFQRQGMGKVPFEHVCALSWEGLRTYLDDPAFISSRGKTKPLEEVRALVRDGCLEAVLDEHLWHAAGSTPVQIATDLLATLTLTAGNFRFHSLKRAKSNQEDKGIRVPCRAAVSFGGAERADATGRAARPDAILLAFNSPFRPFLLASTSVGQEGLDFHVWCDSLAHWDLCSTPLDLEQREGRIQRYRNLAIRRALAAQTANRVMPFHGKSPWQAISASVESDPISLANGMIPWWICPGASLHTYVFLLKESRDVAKYKLLCKQRMLYRLALGQPNPNEFIAELAQAVVRNPTRESQVLKLLLDLSPDRNTLPYR